MAHAALTLSSRRGGTAGLGGWMSRIFLTIELAMQVRRERRDLQALSEAGLKDIGLSKSAVHDEANRTFWDIPLDRWRSQ